MSGTTWLETAWQDTAGDIAGGMEGVADLAKGISPEWLGPAGAILGGGIDLAKGVESIDQGEYVDGVTDLVKGIGGSAKGGIEVAGGEAPDWLDVVTGGADVVHGIHDIATDEGYGGQTCDGIHDILAGGSDVVGGLAPEGSETKILAEMFGAGMKVGDFVAPYVFNDAASEGARTQAIPEGGFRASSGNASFDGLAHGIEDIGNGDYFAGAQNLAQAATGSIGAEAIANVVTNLWE